MKRRYAALLLSAVLGLSVLNGCSGADKGTKTESAVPKSEEDKNTVYGEVSQIAEDSITIKIGNRKERERPEGEHPEQPEGEHLGQPEGERIEKPSEEQSKGKLIEEPSAEQPAGEMPDRQQGEMPSMLELTGEEQEIKIENSTRIKRRNMGKKTGEQGTEEEITVLDLSQGDMIQAVFAEDGSAEEIIVISPSVPGEANPSSQPGNNETVSTYHTDTAGEADAADGSFHAVLYQNTPGASKIGVCIRRESI